MGRVLVVDDDPQMTRIMRRILKKAGFDVECINRSFGVLNRVAELRPDVVVMDMNMPGLRGPELLQLLRADDELAATRVLLFSGVLEAELATFAETSGADGYVHKTAPPAALVDAVRAALAA